MKLDETNDGVARNNRSDPAKDRPTEYLDREAGSASDEILGRLKEISERLKPSSAVARVVERHPWRTTALASALGFCLGAFLTGRRRRAPAAKVPATGAEPPVVFKVSETAGRTPWWTSLIGPSLDVARIFAERWAVNALTGRHERSDQPPPRGHENPDATGG
jgi:ElaB/YqjD/DUF883 family membrane-anchored ribosome-binding protein